MIQSFKWIYRSLIFILFCVVLINSHANTLDPKVIELLKPKLNSERIEYLFGSYGVESLNVCSDIFKESRISNLYSVHDGDKVMRTFAVVDFVKPIPQSLVSVHHQIQTGASIGTALRNAGLIVIKNPIYFGEIDLSIGLLKKMHEKSDYKGAVYIYQLQVMDPKDASQVPYCRIIEVYSSQYMNLQWLKALNNNDYAAHLIMNDATKELLDRAQHCISSL
jgi:putative ubiquitin-RnfH superfamily antitoxin RatB of RatAB toxin-antitoxin module